MGKTSKKLLALILCMAMAITLLPQMPVQAKTTKLSKCSITIEKKSYYYTGKAIKPKVTVKYNGKILKSGKNYTVKYKNNTKPGTATVTITGKGSYKGTVKRSFKIKNGLTIKLSKTNYTYTGKAIKPKLTVKSGKTKLTKKQYTIKYKNNKKVGTAEIIVSGKGKYKNKKAYTTFKIVEKDQQPDDNKPDDNEPEDNKPEDGKLAIEEKDGILLEGQTHQIKVLSSQGTASFSSSNENVATVDGQGIIYPRAAGDTVIIVKDSLSQLSFKLTVVRFDYSCGGMTLAPAETVQLSLIQGEGSCKYTWCSSNTDILTVDQTGFVTAGIGNGGTASIYLEVDTLSGKANSNGAEFTVKSMDSLYKVTKTGSSYAVASGLGKAITSNMDFSLNLVEGGLDTVGENGNAFWHNTGLSTIYYGGYNYYFVSDTWNNRVLIYKVPKDQTWGLNDHNVNQTQYLYCVLGQTSIDGRKAGYKLDAMNWPNEAVAAVVGSTVKLFVTDTHNDRILVWDDLFSEIEAATTVNGVHYAPAADYSIMDKCDSDKMDFDNESANGRRLINSTEAMIRWPWAVWTDGTRLMCTSTTDGYLLIWDQLPTSSDRYPDKVIYTGGTIRTITCKDNYVLLGDHNIQLADNSNESGIKIIDDYSKFSYTAITEKGNSSNKLFDYAETKLKTSDADGKNVYSYMRAEGHQQSGIFLTSNLAIANGQTLPAGTLLLSHRGRIEVYKDGKIDGPNDLPDYYIGGGTTDDERLFYFTSADYAPIIIDHNGNLYNSMGNTGMIAGYKAGTLPSEPADKTAADIASMNSGDVVIIGGQYYCNNKELNIIEKHCTETPNIWIGSEKVDDDAYKKTYRYQNCMVSSDGSHLVATADHGTGSVLMLWKNIPDQSEAVPDVVYEFIVADIMNDTALYNNGTNTMLMAGGRNSLYIWNDISKALDGGTPDIYLKGKIGNVNVNEIQSFAFDGEYFYLSDNNGIYIFQGIPTSNQAPVSTLDYKGCKIDVTTCNNGTTYLTATSAIPGDKTVIYSRDQALKNGNEFVLKGAVVEIETALDDGTRGTEQLRSASFNGVGSVLVTKEGKVILSDSGSGVIYIWDSIEEAVKEGNSSVKSSTRIELGYGRDSYNSYDVREADASLPFHSIGGAIPTMNDSGSTLYRPTSLAYDGTYLWVGDFKFSGGIKRIN